MTTRTNLVEDELSGGEPADRVFYATGVLLDAEDFRDEQTYHRARLARALEYAHSSGTVAGLRVEYQAPSEEGDDGEEQDERLLVHPGLAIDPQGRLIEIPRAACFRLGRWFEQQTIDDLTVGIVENYAIGIDETDEVPGAASNVTGVIADVYVRFVACERGKTPAFAAGPFDALDAVSPSRLRDSYELSWLIRKETNPPSPTRPFVPLAGVPVPVASKRLRLAMLDAWREGTADDSETASVHAHAVGQDPTSVFLARVVIPVTGVPTVGERPERTDDPVIVLNVLRPFVYPAVAIARRMNF